MGIVLVVDDDAAMREALSEAIASLGHTARQAESGIAAMRILSTEPVDATLVDLRMKGMDGLELLTRIRAMESPPPTVMLTAHATAHNMEQPPFQPDTVALNKA